MILAGATIVVLAFVAWATAIATLPAVMLSAGVIGLIVGVLMMFVVGDTNKGGDSGVTLIYLLACIGSIVVGCALGGA